MNESLLPPTISRLIWASIVITIVAALMLITSYSFNLIREDEAMSALPWMVIHAIWIWLDGENRGHRGSYAGML